MRGYLAIVFICLAFHQCRTELSGNNKNGEEGDDAPMLKSDVRPYFDGEFSYQVTPSSIWEHLDVIDESPNSKRMWRVRPQVHKVGQRPLTGAQNTQQNAGQRPGLRPTPQTRPPPPIGQRKPETNPIGSQAPKPLAQSQVKPQALGSSTTSAKPQLEPSTTAQPSPSQPLSAAAPSATQNEPVISPRQPGFRPTLHTVLPVTADADPSLQVDPNLALGELGTKLSYPPVDGIEPFIPVEIQQETTPLPSTEPPIFDVATTLSAYQQLQPVPTKPSEPFADAHLPLALLSTPSSPFDLNQNIPSSPDPVLPIDDPHGISPPSQQTNTHKPTAQAPIIIQRPIIQKPPTLAPVVARPTTVQQAIPSQQAQAPSSPPVKPLGEQQNQPPATQIPSPHQSSSGGPFVPGEEILDNVPNTLDQHSTAHLPTRPPVLSTLPPQLTPVQIPVPPTQKPPAQPLPTIRPSVQLYPTQLPLTPPPLYNLEPEIEIPPLEITHLPSPPSKPTTPSPSQPTPLPTLLPTLQPILPPTPQPTSPPTTSAMPTPTPRPSAVPESTPTPRPLATPASTPSPELISEPVPTAAAPIPEPVLIPTPKPTTSSPSQPTLQPTPRPTSLPTPLAEQPKPTSATPESTPSPELPEPIPTAGAAAAPTPEPELTPSAAVTSAPTPEPTLPPTPAPPKLPKVTLGSGGKLVGNIMKAVNGRSIEAYRGIPYAKPPVGKLRFKPPQAVAPLTRERKALRDAPPCPQHDPLNANVTSGNEDCLYLNVYTPRNRTQHSFLPVMVFFHGGGFNFGSAHSSLYGPERLLAHDVILVTSNYRLGALGFFSTGTLDCPGNNGLKDQVEVLKWVQANIRAFGGDPRNVTIFGQSSGAASVTYHMVSPKTEGLFNKAIVQSGTNYDCWALVQNRTATYRAKRMRNMLDCATPGNWAGVLDCLRNKTAEEIVSASAIFYSFGVEPITAFGPVVEPSHEDAYLHTAPRDIHRPHSVHTPLMIGVTTEEGLIKSGPLIYLHDEIFRSKFNKVLPKLLYYDDWPQSTRQTITTRVDRLYFKSNHTWSKENHHDLTTLFSDRLFYTGMDQYLRNRFAQRNNTFGTTYAYMFDHKGPMSLSAQYGSGPEYYGVVHGDELPYLFPMNATHIPSVENDARFKWAMSRMWTHFAITGNPTPAGSPIRPWKETNKFKLRYAQLGSKNTTDNIIVRNTAGFMESKMRFWRKIQTDFLTDSKQPLMLVLP